MNQLIMIIYESCSSLMVNLMVQTKSPSYINGYLAPSRANERKCWPHHPLEQRFSLSKEVPFPSPPGVGEERFSMIRGGGWGERERVWTRLKQWNTDSSTSLYKEQTFESDSLKTKKKKCEGTGVNGILTYNEKRYLWTISFVYKQFRG